VGDTSFIYNRSTTIGKTNPQDGSAMDGISDAGQTRKNPYLLSTVWVRQRAGYDTDYSIYRDGTEVATYWAQGDDTPLNITSGLLTDLTSNGVTRSRVSQTVISISHDIPNRRITTEDGYGNQALRSYDHTIDEFTDLP